MKQVVTKQNVLAAIEAEEISAIAATAFIEHPEQFRFKGKQLRWFPPLATDHITETDDGDVEVSEPTKLTAIKVDSDGNIELE
jgi:hypothetical protein